MRVKPLVTSLSSCDDSHHAGTVLRRRRRNGVPSWRPRPGKDRKSSTHASGVQRGCAAARVVRAPEDGALVSSAGEEGNLRSGSAVQQ